VFEGGLTLAPVGSTPVRYGVATQPVTLSSSGPDSSLLLLVTATDTRWQPARSRSAATFCLQVGTNADGAADSTRASPGAAAGALN
jgi:hypothetical protein